MLTDDQTTQLQFAIDADDLEAARSLLDLLTPEEVTELQFYLNSSALMYACQRSTPEMVRLFLEKGAGVFELPYSDNNELKSAIQNESHALEITKLVLEMLPADLSEEMIVSDWDPEEGEGEACQSALEMAADKPEVEELLKAALP